ncbi:hypothetical protein Acsp05_38130 [Actinokineospora sp. NBRC 105648]|nr:hypothetical protein Acsp05_38130 [Actinokineospora sp. NBRC 105648]
MWTHANAKLMVRKWAVLVLMKLYISYRERGFRPHVIKAQDFLYKTPAFWHPACDSGYVVVGVAVSQ